MFGGLRPRRFWARLHPAQPSHPRRLVIYSLLALSPLLLTAAVPVLMQAIDQHQQARYGGRYWVRPPLNRPPSWVLPPSWSMRIWDALNNQSPPLIRLGLIFLFWPLATAVTLQLYQVSMRRARVNPVHAVRCTVYSFDAFFWLAWALLLLAPLYFLLLTVLDDGGRLMYYTARFGSRPVLVFSFHALCGMAALAVIAYRLITAYRLYLRFDHPRATVLASQVIVLLLALWFLADTDLFLMLGW